MNITPNSSTTKPVVELKKPEEKPAPDLTSVSEQAEADTVDASNTTDTPEVVNPEVSSPDTTEAQAEDTSVESTLLEEDTSTETLPEGAFPEDVEGVIRFAAFKKVFNTADADGNKAVGRKELNAVDRSELNNNQNKALDLILNNFEEFSGPNRLTLEDLRAVASIDDDKSGISEADFEGAGDQLRGKELREQVADQYGLVVEGDVADGSIVRVVNKLEAIPQEHIKAYQQAGFKVTIHDKLPDSDFNPNGFADDQGAHFSEEFNIIPSPKGDKVDADGNPIFKFRRLDAGGVIQHEVAHGLDKLVPEGAEYELHSESPRFNRILERPRVRQFLEETYPGQSNEEIFARAYSRFYSEPGTEEQFTRSSLPPALRRYFRNIEFTP